MKEDDAPKKRERHDYQPRLADFVEACLGSLKSYGETIDAAMEKTGCSERTAAKAIAAARARWKEAGTSTVDERRDKLRAQIEHAWRKALEAEDFRAIAVMARTLADIEGVKAPKQVVHGGILGLRPVAALSPAEREKELAELLAKRGAAGGVVAPVEGPDEMSVLAEPALGAMRLIERDEEDEPVPAPPPKVKKPRVH